nr:hypothetical protein [uncultured Bilophila sp.]
MNRAVPVTAGDKGGELPEQLPVDFSRLPDVHPAFVEIGGGGRGEAQQGLVEDAREHRPLLADAET